MTNGCAPADDVYGGAATILNQCASALPNTGIDVIWLVLGGLILFALGVLLRRAVV